MGLGGIAGRYGKTSDVQLGRRKRLWIVVQDLELDGSRTAHVSDVGDGDP